MDIRRSRISSEQQGGNSVVFKNFCSSLIAVLVVNGCATSGVGSDFPAQDFEKLYQEFEGRAAALRETYPEYPKVGTTYLSFDPDHKFQVTYYENETRSWLWYGGNDIALPSEWKVEERDIGEHGTPLSGEARTQICWKYGSNTYNPSTGNTGGKFQCTVLINALQITVSSLDGDVFNLSSGEVPYSRQKCDAPDDFVIQTENTLFGIKGADDCLKGE
ncbi:hypothetical protein [Hyphomonas chukchiensis]|uniref:hypothetical protein n=1 Tax=Hyphomonas chukchiensis TaxID=1280947 RepID=UPI0012DF187A|nr:hypothetical protein [Hyphomonas chukchiensis]